jgi:hypothetical protein
MTTSHVTDSNGIGQGWSRFDSGGTGVHHPFISASVSDDNVDRIFLSLSMF